MNVHCNCTIVGVLRDSWMSFMTIPQAVCRLPSSLEVFLVDTKEFDKGAATHNILDFVVVRDTTSV